MRRKTGSIQKRGDSWRISYYDVNSTRQYETISDELTALATLASRVSDVAKGIPVTAQPGMVRFDELCLDVIDDYEVNGRRSRKDAKVRVGRHIDPVFGAMKASQITGAQINSYAIARRAEGAPPATINRELALIRRAFNLAIQNCKLLMKPHVAMLRENNVRTGFFTREEVDRLCLVLKEPYSSFVLFAFLTGWRTGEIRGLEWRNVDFGADEIRLDPGTTKNGEARVFSMTTELRSLLKARQEVQKAERKKGKAVLTPYVFEVAGKPIGEFRKTWKTANRAAGLPCIFDDKGKFVRAVRIFHDLRRSAAREMENAGVPRSTIKDLMGHKTDSMFSRYRIVSAADKKRAAEIIDGARSGAKGATETG